MNGPHGTVDKAAARRGALVEAAFAAFTERGYHATGVADIVRRAGVSHGTFYNYFENKRHVLDAVLDHGVRHVVESVVGDDRPGGSATTQDYVAGFRRMIERLAAVLEREPKLVEFVVLEAPAIDPDVVLRLVDLFGTFTAVTREFLLDGIAKGFLRPDLDADLTSEALLSLLTSMVLLAARGPLTAGERERQIDVLVDLAFTGVMA